MLTPKTEPVVGVEVEVPPIAGLESLLSSLSFESSELDPGVGVAVGP